MDKLLLNTIFAKFDQGQTRFFICYSRKDAKARDIAIESLKLLDRNNEMTFFFDDKAHLGVDWDDIIKAAIERATCSLLLISDRWFDPRPGNKNYIIDEELPAIRSRLARPSEGFSVLPLLLNGATVETLQRLDIGHLQAVELVYGSDERMVSITSLSRIKRWLRKYLAYRQRRRIRRSFKHRMLNMVLIAAVVIIGLGPAALADWFQSLFEEQGRFGLHEIGAKMSTLDGADIPYRTSILRANVNRRLLIKPFPDEAGPIVTTQDTAFERPRNRTLWVRLEANSTGIVSIPEKLSLVTADDDSGIRPGNLIIMTPYEYHLSGLQVVVCGTLFMLYCAFVLSTLRDRVIDDRCTVMGSSAA